MLLYSSIGKRNEWYNQTNKHKPQTHRHINKHKTQNTKHIKQNTKTGVQAIVSAIYEPPQKSNRTKIQLENPGNNPNIDEAHVHELCEMLGMYVCMFVCNPKLYQLS